MFDYSAPAVSGIQAYSLSGANAGAAATFGDYKFTPTPASENYIYLNHFGGNSNRLDLLSTNETTPGFNVPYRSASAYIQISDNTGLFSSSTLPPLSAYGAVPLSGIVFTANVVAPSNNNVSGVSGSVSALSAELVNPNVAPVPEASTTVSLGVLLGLGGLALAVRRRKIASR